MLLTFTKNGIINITNASSTFGSGKGDRIKSFTFSQTSDCIIIVIEHFTITIKHTYKEHCVNHVLADGGFPEKIFVNKTKLYI